MRKKTVVILNVILIILMSIGLFLMFSKHAQRSPEAFIERGFRNFRYFTVLSNVYSGLVAGVYIILLICRRKTESGTLMSVLKLTSAAAVGIACLLRWIKKKTSVRTVLCSQINAEWGIIWIKRRKN